MPGPAVPSSEEVTAYLAAHKLEPVIEDAVNDAVLKQVKVRAPRRSAARPWPHLARPPLIPPAAGARCAEPVPAHCRDPAQEERGGGRIQG